MKDYTKKSLTVFIDDVASSLPAPGGGSVNALVSSLGFSLLEMCCHFSYKKITILYKKKKIRQILKLSRRKRRVVFRLINEDIKAYKLVVDSFKTPKGNKKRKRLIENALKKATAVPFCVFKLCCEGVDLISCLFPFLNKRLLSDFKASLNLFSVALEGAEDNIKENLILIKDKSFVEKTEREFKSLKRKVFSKISKLRDKIEVYKN